MPALRGAVEPVLQAALKRARVDRVSRWTARAPGRLDVMGGIADYSGSLVLQWPIRESTRATVQFRPSQFLRVVSRNATGRRASVEVPLALVNAARPPYDEIRAWFAEDATRHWAAYVAGVFAVLAGEHGVTFDQGAIVEIELRRPRGQGRQQLRGARGRDGDRADGRARDDRARTCDSKTLRDTRRCSVSAPRTSSSARRAA